MAKKTTRKSTKKTASKKKQSKRMSSKRKSRASRESGGGRSSGRGHATFKPTLAGPGLSNAPPPPGPALMQAPPSGVRVRMYRQGHGDCFLLAFRRDDGKPFYVLIDCGMKKGSRLRHSMEEVVASIKTSTGGHIHLAVITHEHEDHVSGFLSEREVIDKLTIDCLWLAWTEDPENPVANRLREQYHDVLIGLAATSGRLEGVLEDAEDPGGRRARSVLDEMLGFSVPEIDQGNNRGLAAAGKIDGISLKNAMKVVKDRASLQDGIRYLTPGEPPLDLDGVSGLRVFVLGPPEDADLLQSMDPSGGEEFSLAEASAAQANSFLAAVGKGGGRFEAEAYQPFDAEYRIHAASVRNHPLSSFFDAYYGPLGNATSHRNSWRRIDADWLRVGEQIALRMGNYINNTSLVLAFELPKSKKVLLFVGDAQRGNWVSWAKLTWDGSSGLGAGESVSAADLLARTVVYKVGHHGSHNATLNKGGLGDMAKGGFGEEFVALIPANEAWALSVKPAPWVHPYPPILKALETKAKGRVFRMDSLLDKPNAHVISDGNWSKFLDRCAQNSLYCEIVTTDGED